MLSFKDYLSRIDLSEAVVVNPDDVQNTARLIARDITNSTANDWLVKRVRSHIMNTPALLSAVDPSSLPVQEVPDYVRAAIDRQENVYSFSPTQQSPERQAFFDKVQHIKDWIISMELLLGETPTSPVEKEDHVATTKIMAKLPRLTIDQAHQAADQWFSRIGARHRNGEAMEGVTVIKRWPDGFYAVEFTSIEAMKRDGNQLQNCLSGAYYWHQVQSGTNRVISIRKPNHEAVVGIRIATKVVEVDDVQYAGSVMECKGKNNKPVIAQYAPYCSSMLNELNVYGGNNADLLAAGISSYKGNYGTLDEVGQIIYKDKELSVFRTDDAFLLLLDKHRIGGKIANGRFHVGSIPEGANVAAISRGLTQLDLEPVSDTIYNLRKYGVFYHNGLFGPLEAVGNEIGAKKDYRAFLIDREIVITRDGNPIVRFQLSSGKIDNYIFTGMSASQGKIILTDLLNLTQARPEQLFEFGDLLRQKIYFDGNRYGKLEDLGIKEEDGLYRLGERPVWVLETQTTPTIFEVRNRRVKTLVDIDNPVNVNAARRLLGKLGVTDVDFPRVYKVIQMADRIITSKDEFFEALGELTSRIPPTAFSGSSVVQGDGELVRQVRTYLNET